MTDLEKKVKELEERLETVAQLASRQSALSKPAILRHMEEGNIVIDPYTPEQLNTGSYDCKIGEWFYREQDTALGVLNPYNEEEVRRVWGEPQKAVERWQIEKDEGIDLSVGIGPEEKIIMLKPGETILGHTDEFIGGRNNIITMMKGRSSYGRIFVDPCKAAGWGDVGYINRWTMEITNFSKHNRIPLVVGRRIPQIVFYELEPIKENSYESTGKYQTAESLEDLRDKWRPDDMLPKMWKDREAQKYLKGDKK